MPKAKGSAARTFATGATRDAAEGKPPYERALSPLFLARFGRYMWEHNALPDGTRRCEDDWQKGMGLENWMDSAWRHFHAWWSLHRGHEVVDVKGQKVDIEEAMMGLYFNLQGYFHERAMMQKRARRRQKHAK